MEQELRRYVCKYCGRECKSERGLHNHEKSCNDNPCKITRTKQPCCTDYLKPQELNCSYCDKICKNINSLKQHECRCSMNPNRKDAYKLGVNVGTAGKPKPWLKGLINITNGVDNARVDPKTELPEGWRRGYTSQRIYIPIKHTEETKQRISKSVSVTRKQRIAEGLITPNTNYRFITAYIEFSNNTRKLLRSSYEIILALYLDIMNIHFEYEKIRLKYMGEDQNEHTYITDFYLPEYNHIIEVKGNTLETGLDRKLTALSDSEYQYTLVSETEIEQLRDKLQNYLDLDTILQKCKSQSITKDRYVYKLINN